MNQHDTAQMHRLAAGEIRDLRRQNELLRVQAETFNACMMLLGAEPPRTFHASEGLDLAHQLDQAASTAEAEPPTDWNAASNKAAEIADARTRAFRLGFADGRNHTQQPEPVPLWLMSDYSAGREFGAALPSVAGPAPLTESNRGAYRSGFLAAVAGKDADPSCWRQDHRADYMLGHEDGSRTGATLATARVSFDTSAL